MPRARTAAPALLAAALLAAAPLAGDTFPANFTHELVASIGGPTALAFTPDGRLLVTSQSGTLRVVANATTATPSAPVTVMTMPATKLCFNFERGLLGVAVDPAFATNHYIYLYYTNNTDNHANPCLNNNNAPRNRVSRFTLPDSGPIDMGTELVLVDNIRAFGGNHNAGDVRFGRDGYLYISTGDGGTDYDGSGGSGGSNNASRDIHQLIGKILRIDPRGDPNPAVVSVPPFIPASNPFAGGNRCNVAGETTAGNHCQETFARGFRNPFRFATDPNDAGTKIYVNDVGQGTWEEIDALASGGDFGWNCREGAHTNSTSGPCSPTPPSMIDPVFEYQHGGVTVPGAGNTLTNCNSITGGAFVPNGVWPAAYDGTFLFADYVCGGMYRIPGAGLQAAAFEFGTGVSGPTSLAFGPYLTTQALYYCAINSGQVRRVRYVPPGGNAAPTAVIGANPTAGLAPLAVTFDATGSSDPNAGDTLTYFWDYGDGTPIQSTASLTIGHNYLANGTYTASLRARDQNLAFSSPVTTTITVGNRPPVATITSPSPGFTFAVGDLVTLQGTGTDPDEGALPGGNLSWTILLHHDTHTHPFQSGTGASFAFTTQGPEDLSAAANSFLEAHLVATDTPGLPSADVRLDLNPKKVDVTVQSAPTGARIGVNGQFLVAPTTFTSWEAWNLNLSAPDQTLPDGRRLLWTSWSDAGARDHTVATPATATTRTANFAATGTRYHPLTPCRVADTRTVGGVLGANADRLFSVGAVCGIPANAHAVAFNVTVVTPSANGTATLYPGHMAAPPPTSTVGFRVGTTRAVNALCYLAGDGSGTVKVRNGSAGTIHVVLDASGWFE